MTSNLGNLVLFLSFECEILLLAISAYQQQTYYTIGNNRRIILLGKTDILYYWEQQTYYAIGNNRCIILLRTVDVLYYWEQQMLDSEEERRILLTMAGYTIGP